MSCRHRSGARSRLSDDVINGVVTAAVTVMTLTVSIKTFGLTPWYLCLAVVTTILAGLGTYFAFMRRPIAVTVIMALVLGAMAWLAFMPSPKSPVQDAGHTLPTASPIIGPSLGFNASLSPSVGNSSASSSPAGTNTSRGYNTAASPTKDRPQSYSNELSMHQNQSSISDQVPPLPMHLLRHQSTRRLARLLWLTQK
jgi:hypothetical protein